MRIYGYRRIIRMHGEKIGRHLTNGLRNAICFICCIRFLFERIFIIIIIGNDSEHTKQRVSQKTYNEVLANCKMKIRHCKHTGIEFNNSSTEKNTQNFISFLFHRKRFIVELSTEFPTNILRNNLAMAVCGIVRIM